MERTKCTYCGTETETQPVGDGCHACSRGTMAPVNDEQFDYRPDSTWDTGNGEPACIPPEWW